MMMRKYSGYILSLLLLGLNLSFGQNNTDMNVDGINVDGTPDTEVGPVEAEEVDEELNAEGGISVEAQAFILVIAAGLCTCIGASVVFFPCLASLAKPNILCLALGFAAGIMLYISLIDIFGKSSDGYIEQGHSDGRAFIYANLSFFGGCIVMLILDVLVDLLLQWDVKRAEARGDAHLVRASVGSAVGDGAAIDKMREDFVKTASVREDGAEEPTDKMDEVMAAEQAPPAESAAENGFAVSKNTTENGEENGEKPITTEGEAKSQLTHMGWAMMAAIAIHNFPEGMVTYLAYTQDNAVGIALAIGIAIHNIPEGLCVAMPLYYATGRRAYSFMWGTFSGLTEPLGALIVWGVLKNGMSGNTNGILFGLVSGMMTVISIDELLPTAHKYTSNPKMVTYAAIFGMFFIASSLMLFEV